MKRPTRISTTIWIERDDAEVECALDGEYFEGCRGVKDHPMDRFAPPDDEPEMELLTAKVNGVEVDLTEAETDQADDALKEALNDMANVWAEERAERRANAGRDE